MRPQYSHDVVSSFSMWLMNQIEATGQAYQNVTGSLYRQQVTGVPGWVYASPYKSWVWDSCVGGATVPTGFMNNSGQFLTRASGLVLDFVNGRVISPQNWGGTLSGVYARKEVNIYLSSPQETAYVMEQVYKENPNVNYPLTGFQGRALVAPLMMITNSQGENQPWALGGMDNSKNTLRCFTISNSTYLQEGINSLCQDAAHSYVPIATYADTPITASGDLKTPGWSYCADIKDTFGCANGLWVNAVYAYKLGDMDYNRLCLVVDSQNVQVRDLRT